MKIWWNYDGRWIRSGWSLPSTRLSLRSVKKDGDGDDGIDDGEQEYDDDDDDSDSSDDNSGIQVTEEGSVAAAATALLG